MLGFRSLSMMPRFKLLASLSCLCSEGLIFPTSGSHTVTSSFREAIGDGINKFAPDSYTTKLYQVWILCASNRHIQTGNHSSFTTMSKEQVWGDQIMKSTWKTTRCSKLQKSMIMYIWELPFLMFSCSLIFSIALNASRSSQSILWICPLSYLFTSFSSRSSSPLSSLGTYQTQKRAVKKSFIQDNN